MQNKAKKKKKPNGAEDDMSSSSIELDVCSEKVLKNNDEVEMSIKNYNERRARELEEGSFAGGDEGINDFFKTMTSDFNIDIF